MTDWRFYGNTEGRFVLIRTADEADVDAEKRLYERIRALSASDDFVLAVYPIRSWNNDLSPWEAPPVFGKEPFGNGAKETLRGIEAELENGFSGKLPARPDRKYIIGGYSLAGLFALWAAFESGAFSGAAACSPSVWFPGFTDFAKSHPVQAEAVYLSLGNREEKAKNRTFAAVGDCIRECDRILEERGLKHVLEWNEGNHFVDGELRTAKGYAWVLKELEKTV